jgi:hypothetical protein
MAESEQNQRWRQLNGYKKKEIAPIIGSNALPAKAIILMKFQDQE